MNLTSVEPSLNIPVLCIGLRTAPCCLRGSPLGKVTYQAYSPIGQDLKLLKLPLKMP